jgi:endonuclease YncB( thermonuclease family)
MKTRPSNRLPPKAPPTPRLHPSSDPVVRWPRWLLAAACLALAATVGADEPVKMGVPATVTRVNDGDSIEVQVAAGPGRVRFAAIDTPEYDQPYGDKSSAALKAMLPVGSKVELDVITQDAFRRMVATVWLEKDGDRINLNEAMLRQGHAWAYRRYMREAKYCDMEAEARDKKLGLWAQPVSEWIYPPEWRFLRNGEIRALPTPYPETREKCLDVLKLAGAATYTPPN